MSTNRKPAITRTTGHPADTIPDRPGARAQASSQQAQSSTTTAGERLTEQHNVRIRPSVKHRLGQAVDKLRYETGDRTISIASLTDEAIDAYLTQRGC